MAESRGWKGWYLDRQPADVVVRQLQQLPMNHAAVPGYFEKLAGSRDEVLRIGGLSQLLGLGVLPRGLWESAVALSRHGAVRSRAFDFFLRSDEHDWARRVLAVPREVVGTLREDLRQSRLDFDFPLQLRLEVATFIEDGRLDHLSAAIGLAEAIGGWRMALPWAVRRLMLAPDESGAFGLLDLLKQFNQLALMRTTLAAFQATGRFPPMQAIFTAALRLAEGQPTVTLAILGAQRQRAPDNRVQAFIEMLRAEASEACGKYEDAYGYFVRMNEERRFVRSGVVQPNVDPARYLRRVVDSDKLLAEPLPDDPNRTYFAMVGFPRSGTTLLENALATHPDIETLEEVPSSLTALSHLEASGQRPVSQAAGLAARDDYYKSIEAHRTKRQATIVVDKMPLESAEAPHLVKFFPGKRYIFSIRDPRDVVFSCFRTSFLPNDAMEHFRTFASACRLYDFTMSRWFAHFALEDERVCYVRYENLVTQFAPEVRRVLAFVGAQWHPAVLAFAEAAQKRGSATPSYEKVRRGLKLGVQSHWQNYPRLFEGEEARPLARWIELFGYDVGEPAETAGQRRAAGNG